MLKYANGLRVDCSQYEGVVVKAETIVSFGRRLRFSLGIYEKIFCSCMYLMLFEFSLFDVQKTFLTGINKDLFSLHSHYKFLSL